MWHVACRHYLPASRFLSSIWTYSWMSLLARLSQRDMPWQRRQRLEDSRWSGRLWFEPQVTWSMRRSVFCRLLYWSVRVFSSVSCRVGIGRYKAKPMYAQIVSAERRSTWLTQAMNWWRNCPTKKLCQNSPTLPYKLIWMFNFYCLKFLWDQTVFKGSSLSTPLHQEVDGFLHLPAF